MKSLQEYLDCNGVFVIPRSQMPQIDDIESFKKHLDSIGVWYVETEVHHSSIQPTQKDLDQNKIDSIRQNLIDNPNQSIKPVIVSNYLHVLDGHHRWAALKELDLIVPAVVVDLPINKLLKVAYDYIS